MSKIFQNHFLNYSIILLGMIFFVFFRFHQWIPQGFWGDDLMSLQAFYNENFSSSLFQSLFSSFFEKYRPVYQVFNWLLFSLFGKNINYYMGVNFLIQIISGSIFYYTVIKLSNFNFIVSTLLTLLFVSSKFALFQMTLVIGTVESLSLLFFQLSILCFVLSLENDKFFFWNILTIINVGLCIYTHERYIVIALWFAMIIWFLPRIYISFKDKLLLMIGYAVLIASNILIKKYCLGLPFFVGTGGTHIAFDLSSMVEHVKEFYLSLVGFNYGPLYLLGASIILPTSFTEYNQNLLYFILASCFFITTMLVIFLNIFNSQNRTKNVYVLIFICLLIAMLSAPPVVTIRVEGRWIYSAYMILLYMIAWASGLNKWQSKNNILVGVIFTMMLFCDGYVASSFGSIYLTGWNRISGVVKNEILPIYALSQQPNLVLEIEDESFRNTLITNGFFQFYTGYKKEIIYVKNDNELFNIKKLHPDYYAFKYNNNYHFDRV